LARQLEFTGRHGFGRNVQGMFMDVYFLFNRNKNEIKNSVLYAVLEGKLYFA
jgi:hypothetical protein